MSKRGHHTKQPSTNAEKEIFVRLPVDEDDARDLERLAQTRGVSVDTLLSAAISRATAMLSGEPVSPSTVEYLARRGYSILRKRELN